MAEQEDMKGKANTLPLSKRNVIKVKVNGVEKRYKPSRHYVYILQVRWSDLSEYIIYRKYSDFYTLQCGIVDKFPIEAGAIRESDRTLPYLPGRLLFSRTEVSKVANQRRQDLAEYCSKLLELDPKISQSAEVIDFFEATFEDINPPKDATKKPEHSRLILALLPFLKKKNKDGKEGPVEECAPIRRAKSTTVLNMKLTKKDLDIEDEELDISGPITLETYVVVADYEAVDKSEVTLKEGDNVEVFEKNSNGWWFVQTESEKQGWAPASYLDPVSHLTEVDEPEPTFKGNLEKYITTEAYKAQYSDEISFEKDVILEVMHKLLDGWWIVSYQGDAGYAPAAYMEPYENPHLQRSSTVKRPTIKPIPRRITIKSKSNSSKKGKQRDLTLYRKYSRKRKTGQPASDVAPAPPKPPRIIEEEQEDTSTYVNTGFNNNKTLSTDAVEEEEPTYLEVEPGSMAVYENITEEDIEEAQSVPTPPPRPGAFQKTSYDDHFSASTDDIYDDIENVLPCSNQESFPVTRIPTTEYNITSLSVATQKLETKDNGQPSILKGAIEKISSKPPLPNKKPQGVGIASNIKGKLENKETTSNDMDAHRKHLNAIISQSSAIASKENFGEKHGNTTQNGLPVISSFPSNHASPGKQKEASEMTPRNISQPPVVAPKPSAKNAIASRVALFEK